MYVFTHPGEARKKQPRNVLLTGLIVSVSLVLLLVREPKTSRRVFDNRESMDRQANQQWDLYGNTDSETDTSCLRLIFYDKPVKTGSTSVEKALMDYLGSRGEEAMSCGTTAQCTVAAEEVCLGIRPKTHLVHHVRLNSSIVSCLHDKGFYHVTSIREPKERILSAFKYNRAMQASFNGISHNVTFEEYLELFPRCGLYNYYDGLGARCPPDYEGIEARARNIVDRMDEVIDLSEEPISDVHGRINKYIKSLNVAVLKGSKAKELEVPDEVSDPEYVLYNMLKEKRESLALQPRRRLCNGQ